MEWELSKENVQPVKAGRNVEVLNDALKAKADGPARSNIFEHQRRQFLEAIENYVGEDPLDPWIRYIKWVNDAYPAGGAQSELLKLLERCTRKFQKDERYRRDRRYLLIWVQYADCCSDPSDVFAFLESNDIGQDHAIFYRAYATSLEVRRNFSKADEIYSLGIQRSAQPLGRLESMYKSFLSRMFQRGERKLREEQQVVANGYDENDVQLRSFGSSAVSSGEDAVGQQAQRCTARPPPVPARQRARRPENAQLSVFVDPEFGGSPKVNAQEACEKESRAAPWYHMGSDADRTKENVQQPTKWSDAKMKQGAYGQQSRRSNLNILIDEEFADVPNHKPHVHVTKSAAPSLRLRLEDMQTNKRHSSGLKGSFSEFPEACPSSMAVGPVKYQAEGSRNSSTQNTFATRSHLETVFGYNTSILSEHGTERSFEELRWAVWNEKELCDTEAKESKPIESADPDKFEDTPSSPLPSIYQDSDKANVPHLSTELDDLATRKVTYTANSALPSSPCQRPVDGDDDGFICIGSLSQCSNQGVINQMMNCSQVIVDFQREPGTTEEDSLTDCQLQPQKTILNSSSPEQAAIVHLNSSNSFTMQGDETVAIKRFAEEVIVLGSDHKVNSSDAVGHRGLVEPTINTKEALADILDMFNMPLQCDNSRSKARLPKDTKKLSSNPPDKSAGFQIFVDEDLDLQSPIKAIQGDNSRSKAKLPKDTKKHSSNPLDKSAGFQVFVDEDLDLQSPIKANKNEARVRASSGRSSAELPVQRSGFHIYADENIAVQRPARTNNNSKVVSRSLDPTVQSTDFHIYEDDDLCVQGPDDFKMTPKNPKVPSSKSSIYPMVQSGATDGLAHEDLNLQRALTSNNQKQANAATNNASNLANDSSDFQILVDDDFMIERPVQHGRNDNKLEASTTESPLHQAICVDDDMQELSLGSGQRDSKNISTQPQDHYPLAKDKEIARRASEKTDSGVHGACTTRDVVFGQETSFKDFSPGLEKTVLEGRVADQSNSESSERPMLFDLCESSKLTSESTTNTLRKWEGNAAAVPITVDPWEERTLQGLLTRLKPLIAQFEGFFESCDKYSGSIPISSLRSSNARNKIFQLGTSTYRLKGCIGQGAFAQVFELEDEDDDLFGIATKLALKFQKPPCLWEFYIYRQLDMRISSEDRSYYGHARTFYLYSDSSFMVCDYGEKGTLQDVVNAYLAVGQRMDEVLCMYYTIEMLRMLEILHEVGIIHGDFKPDNLLIRDDSDELEAWTPDRLGCWKSQGLSLIDWGRSIDVTLHPEGTLFKGDCKTDSFRCPEMLEHRPWTFQVDTFGLCAVVHCLLHGNYMQVEKTQTEDAQTIYRPKSPYRRYWNVKLWRVFFETLLNANNSRDITQLSALRRAFEEHLTDNSLGKKLKGLLAKQTIMMFTRP